LSLGMVVTHEQLFHICLLIYIFFSNDFLFCCFSLLKTTKLGLLVMLQGNHLALGKSEAAQGLH